LFRFMRFHAVKDLEHRKELFSIINQAPAGPAELIAYSAENVLEYFSRAAAVWSKL
jgi:hypothetical protein